MSTTTDKKQKRTIFTIETYDQAQRAIQHSSAAFLILTVIFGITGIFFYESSSLIHVLIFGVLAIALLYLKSRIVALLLLLTSTLTILPIFTNLNSLLAGGNILIAFVLLWASIKAVEATFKLQGKLSSGPGDL